MMLPTRHISWQEADGLQQKFPVKSVMEGLDHGRQRSSPVAGRRRKLSMFLNSCEGLSGTPGLKDRGAMEGHTPHCLLTINPTWPPAVVKVGVLEYQCQFLSREASSSQTERDLGHRLRMFAQMVA